MPTTKDAETWLPQLVRDKWDAAVQSLGAAGVTIPKDVKPRVAGQSSPSMTAPRLSAEPVIKCYRVGDETSVLVSWGSTDRDVTATYALDAQISGPRAREAARATELIVDRVLAMHRKDPHADWHQITGWRAATPESYHDYQHVVFTLTLARYGEVLPTSVVDA